MKFEDALSLVEFGLAVRRPGWPEGTFLVMVNEHCAPIPCDSEGKQKKPPHLQTNVDLDRFLAVCSSKTRRGEAWAFGVADYLADDWQQVDP